MAYQTLWAKSEGIWNPNFFQNSFVYYFFLFFSIFDIFFYLIYLYLLKNFKIFCSVSLYGLDILSKNFEKYESFFKIEILHQLEATTNVIG